MTTGRHLRQPTPPERDVTRLNERTRRPVDWPREWSTERKVPEARPADTRPLDLGEGERGTARG